MKFISEISTGNQPTRVMMVYLNQGSEHINLSIKILAAADLIRPSYG